MTDFLYDRSVILKFENRDTLEEFQVTGNKIDFQVEKQVSQEPNTAFIDIYNLSDDTAQKLVFRKKINQVEFGLTVKLLAGYRGREKKIFQGVIIAADLLKEGVTRIVRIEARNIYWILQKKRVKRTFAKDSLKSQAILTIINDITGENRSDASLSSESIAFVRSELGNERFKDTTTFEGAAAQIIETIEKGLLGRINILFDDAGITMQPVGKADNILAIRYAPRTGLIGTPQVTVVGVDFVVALDNELKINVPVNIQSDTVRSLNDGVDYVVKKVIHQGINRADGDWQSRVESIFPIDL